MQGHLVHGLLLSHPVLRPKQRILFQHHPTQGRGRDATPGSEKPRIKRTQDQWAAGTARGPRSGRKGQVRVQFWLLTSCHGAEGQGWQRFWPLEKETSADLGRRKGPGCPVSRGLGPQGRTGTTFSSGPGGKGRSRGWPLGGTAAS